MLWTAPPPGARSPWMWALLRLPRFGKLPMQTVTTIGLDIAKSVFQVHGVDAAGEATYDRWQGQARQYHQAGRSILAMVAGCRRDGRHPLCTEAWDQEPAMARTIDGAPTDQGG